MIQVDNSIVARPRATGQTGAGGDHKPSVADNLKTTNKAMVTQIKADVLEFTHHPLKQLGAMAKGMAFPLVHPLTMAKSMVKDIQNDPLEGTIAAAGVASGVAFLGAVLFIGIGVVAAPFTGGASLALAASAASLTTPIAIACLGVDAAGIVLHEVRGANADSEAEAKEQGENLAGYVEDAALNVATWVVGDAVQAKFFKSGPEASLGHALGDAANNGIGLAGVYDVPVPAHPTVHPSNPVRPRVASNPRGDRLDLSFKARLAAARP